MRQLEFLKSTETIMRIILILLSTLTASCSYFSTPALAPYKMDIRQGNSLTTEMREKLKLGMTKQQVRYVLGTPMINDVFHADRWDYPYRLEQQGKVVENQLLTLYFEGNNLVKIDDGKTVEAAAPVEKVAAPVAAPVATPVAAAPKPPQPRPVQIDPEADVLKSVRAWAAAWGAKNAGDYLAFYAADFTPDGMSRDAWKKQRAERLNKPKAIEVALSDINVSMTDDSHATVSFAQRYRADNYHDQVEKTLQLVRQSGRWLIVTERIGKPVKAAREGVYVPAAVQAQAGQQAVQDAIYRWAGAWSARDADKYLSCYGPAFEPEGMSKAAWQAQRKERIAKAHQIEVKVGELKITLHDESHASAIFIQDYRSDTYKDSKRKILLLVKVNDAWLIAAEQAGK